MTKQHYKLFVEFFYQLAVDVRITHMKSNTTIIDIDETTCYD